MTAKVRQGKSKRIAFALIIVCCIAISVFAAFRVVHGRRVRSVVAQTSPNPIGLSPISATPPAVPTTAPNVGLPLRLIIPKLGVDANIEYMGETPTGAMDVPAEVTEAGWYKYGSHPGDEGSAVIAGHLDGVHGEPGVFLNLNKLRVGDNFSVLDDTGKTTNFTVRLIRSYGQDEQPNEVFHSQQGAHLNLITCTGAWNSAEKRFLQRLVVFADKAS